MDNQTLYDKFRCQLVNLHALTVLTVSVIEIIGYIIFVYFGIETFSLTNAYLWYSVVFPISVNAAAHILARILVNHPKVNRKHKNAILSAAAMTTAFLVAIIHKEYIVTSCAFIFPLILTAVFNDKKLLNINFVISVLILICVGTSFYLEGSIDLITALNLLILFGFAFVSYLSAMISIKFSGQNYNTIESQAKQNDRLMEDVMHDQMTGLYNHNSFFLHLDKALQAYSEPKHICISMIDVDDFKRVNDTYGHDCGDVVLTHLAKTILKHLPNDACAYRYGGEEFAVVFMGYGKSEVKSIIQSVLDEFGCHKFSFTNNKITFSSGIAEYATGITRNEFFEQADKTLYRAKREGKNRVLLAE